jgi:hypothetical protein
MEFYLDAHNIVSDNGWKFGCSNRFEVRDFHFNYRFGVTHCVLESGSAMMNKRFDSFIRRLIPTMLLICTFWLLHLGYKVFYVSKYVGFGIFLILGSWFVIVVFWNKKAL